MIQITPHMRLLVAHEAVDFRKGMDGLVAICREKLEQDPFTGTVFVFRNRPQTGIKMLVYDGQGFWLCHKRLSKGRFKWWPTKGKKVADLESFGLQVLMAAGNPTQLDAPEAWRPLNTLGPESHKSDVPENLPIIYRHEHTHHHLSQTRDLPSGHSVHPKSDQKTPGIQSS